MDGDLICNFKKCRKRLSNWAWVTSCSHIFCDEDGSREFNKSYTCPACETNLSGKFDIVRSDLQPSESSKSMVLAGHKPDTILEVCSRAMAFWTYQNHQEMTYQSYVATKARERNNQLEQFYEQVLSRSQTELTSLKSQLSIARKELEETKKRYNEVSEKMMDRSRQYQKLQALYDGLRRRAINPSHIDGEGDNLHATPRMRPSASSFNIGLSASVDEVFRRLPPSNEQDPLYNPNTAERDFVFRPTSTPVLPAPGEVLQRRFNHPLSTPSSLRGQDNHRPRT